MGRWSSWQVGGWKENKQEDEKNVRDKKQQHQTQKEELSANEHSLQVWKEKKDGFAEDTSENIAVENDLKLAAVHDTKDVKDMNVERMALGELTEKRSVRLDEVICFDDAACTSRIKNHFV